ncbi:MAG: type II secretion system F family protein [Lachnospiraceae bacterium]|nr:type II secretion system F family protein [Lachnospiraceae bacterium]
MKESLKQRDYHQYEFDKKEFLLVLLIAAGVVAFLAWFFYRSLWCGIPLSPIGIFLIRYVKRKNGEKRRAMLTEQFKECILSVSASLQAGYAVENAFLESREDMRNLYGEGSMIYEELEMIRRGLVINIPLEELLLDFGERSGCEEIRQFAQLFSIAKRGGGSIPEMIRTSANLISQKIEARQEVQTILSGRIMEQNVMRLMPFGITFYVGAIYHGYFDPLYQDLAGRGVMTLCLLLFLASLFVGEKIFEGIWDQMQGKGKASKLAAMNRSGILGKMAGIGDKIYQRIEGLPFQRAGAERIRKSLETICPDEPREDLLERYYGGKIGMSLLVLLVGNFLALCLWLKGRGDSSGSLAGTIWWMTMFSGIGIFFLMDKDLGDQVKKRRDLLRLSYPDLVQELALYLVAGMTIRSAFGRLGKTNEYAAYACREMQSGQSEALAYENFGKRAGPREYVKLSTLLCQNLKKGNSALMARLEEEAILATESRIQSGRKLGEEAETKLLIPMVMLLAVTMLMIMVPAFDMMGA